MADTLTNAISVGMEQAPALSRGVNLQEAELAGRVRDLFMRARDQRRPLVGQWNKNYRMLKNKYWTAQRPEYMPRPEVAEIFPLIASFVGWMTDQRPTWNVQPYATEHSPYYEMISGMGTDLGVVVHARFEDDDIETENEKIIWDSQIYGTGFSKTGWDNSLTFGMGDATMRRVDPYTLYPDPQATSDKDMNYIIEARTYSLQELDRRWPGSAAKFAGGSQEEVDSAMTQVDGKSREQMPMANPGAISPVTVPRFGKEGQSRLHVGNVDDAGVTVLEAWIREHQVDAKGKVSDGWRCIIVANSRVLFNEKASDMWSHASHPYERFVPYELGEFWGLSLVELLTSPQESLNRLLSSLQYNIELLGNPVFKESARSGLQRTQITNKPGQRITVNDNATAEWLPPPPLHPMIPDLIRYFLQRMEAISGLSSITRGGQPSGRNAAAVVDSMQEASFVRIRMALRNLERFLRRTGIKFAGIIAENYTEPRMIAYTGPDGTNNIRTLKTEHFYIPGGPGQTSMPMRFRLNVDVGSQTQTSREARESKAITLFGLGAIDRMALLEAVDFPNRAAIFERITKLEAAGAFQPPGARQRSRS